MASEPAEHSAVRAQSAHQLCTFGTLCLPPSPSPSLAPLPYSPSAGWLPTSLRLCPNGSSWGSVKVTLTGLPLPVRPEEEAAPRVEERPLREEAFRVVAEEETGVVVLGVLGLAGLELLLLNRDSAGLLPLPPAFCCWG